jgi:HK97 family phage major capsid protein
LDQTLTGQGSLVSNFYGGVYVAAVSEGVAPTNYVDANFKQVTLTMKKNIAVTQVSNELLRMSPISVESLITTNFRKACTSYIDAMVFQGAGSSTQFAGIVGNAACVTVNRQTANKVTLQDLARMYAYMAPQNRKNAVFIINPAVLTQLPIMNGVGGSSGYSPLVFLMNGIEAGYDMKAFNRPILDTEVLPALGSTGDVILADLSAYLVGIEQNITIEASQHYGFTSDSTYFRCTFLADGCPQLTAPITLMDNTTQVSPFVQLSSSVSS